MSNDKVTVRSDAVEWLKKHYPALCEKSGLCERIGGRLYTRTYLDPQADAADQMHQDLKNALDQATELRQQITLMEEHMRGETWRWQADAADDLATMGNRMGVLIYASDLRDLLAAQPAPQALGAAAERMAFLQRHWQSNFHGKRLGQWLCEMGTLMEHGSLIGAIDFARAGPSTTGGQS